MNICIFIKSKNTPVIPHVTQCIEKNYTKASLRQKQRWHNMAKQTNYSLQNKVLNSIILHT